MSKKTRKNDKVDSESDENDNAEVNAARMIRSDRNGTDRRNKVFVEYVNGERLKFCMYVDTAAAKSVMCTKAKDAVVNECIRRNWPYRVVEENEPFRFGPGKRIWSMSALIIAVDWGWSCGNFAVIGDRP